MHKRTLICLPLLSLACTLVASRSAHAEYVGNKYVEPGTGMVLEYNVFVPDGYDPAQKYPLMLVMHAAGNVNPPNRTLSSDGKGWSATFIGSAHQKTDPSFFMIPISQTNSSGWGDPLSPITGTEKFEGRLAVTALKQVVMSKYNIDPTRLYVTGPSMGGRGTWDILRRFPGMFAAGAPTAAPASPADAALYARENVFAVCGEVDPIVQGARDTILAIRKLGGNPIYMELAGHGHDSWRWAYPDAQFLTWMYAQRLGVPWWTVTRAPKAPLQGSSPDAKLSKEFPEAVVAPPNLGTSFPGAPNGNAGAPSSAGSGGSGGQPAANGGTGGAGGVALAGSGGMGVAGSSASGAGGSNSEGSVGSAGALGGAGSAAIGAAGSSAGRAGAATASPAEDDGGMSCRFGQLNSQTRSGWLILGLFGLVASVRRRRRFSSLASLTVRRPRCSARIRSLDSRRFRLPRRRAGAGVCGQ